MLYLTNVQEINFVINYSLKSQCIKKRPCSCTTSIPTFLIANSIQCNFSPVTLAADFQTGGCHTAVKLYWAISYTCAGYERAILFSVTYSAGSKAKRNHKHYCSSR